MSSSKRLADALAKLQAFSDNADVPDSVRGELPEIIEAVEKSMEIADQARELLTNAYSTPDDSEGVRIQSGDAVKLQWALRGVGGADEPDEDGSFNV